MGVILVGMPMGAPLWGRAIKICNQNKRRPSSGQVGGRLAMSLGAQLEIRLSLGAATRRRRLAAHDSSPPVRQTALRAAPKYGKLAR